GKNPRGFKAVSDQSDIAPAADHARDSRGVAMPETLEDASGFQGQADRVFAPVNEAELVQILRQASSDSVPVTIAGARTGLTGGSVPQGGWAISMEKFQ